MKNLTEMKKLISEHTFLLTPCLSVSLSPFILQIISFIFIKHFFILTRLFFSLSLSDSSAFFVKNIFNENQNFLSPYYFHFIDI